MKLLLVDDDRTMRMILKTLLEIEGFSVSIWEGFSFDDILDQTRATMPDLMLLDVHIREIDGLNVVRAIRQDPELARIRVLMTSGMELQDKCLTAGANAFIMKPYMPDELIQRLHSLSEDLQ